MTIPEALKQTAEKHGLGSTLVTGHAAKYWVEAMKLYAEYWRRKSFEDAQLGDSYGYSNFDFEYETYEEYAAKNPLK